MDKRRNDLKKLAKEGLVDISPDMVDDLLDEVVNKYLKEFENQVKDNEQTAAILTTLGTVTETFGIRGSAQLAMDISNNPPILKRISTSSSTLTTTIDLSKHRRTLLAAIIVGATGLLAYDYLTENKDEKEMA